MKIKNLINEIYNEVLNEQTKPIIDVKIEGFQDIEDWEEEVQETLEIINKYFPFNKVTGTYSPYHTDFTFDNGMKIKGKYEEEPYNVKLTFNNGNTYILDIYPINGLGSFDKWTFENEIKAIYSDINSVSIVIGHEGYDMSSITVDKRNLNEYDIYLVDGIQLKGKLIGKTVFGEKNYKKLNISFK
jgi:hypothetical protein